MVWLQEDSLHGDLDVEAQIRIMASYSHGNQADPPPPYSSVVPRPLSPSQDLLSAAESMREGHRHKRQPCSFFLSGYCRNGIECPDYHGVNPDLEELEVRAAVCFLVFMFSSCLFLINSVATNPATLFWLEGDPFDLPRIQGSPVSLVRG